MSKTTIYYFSATGNSLAVARHLAKVLDVGEPISVPGSLVNRDPYVDAQGARAVGFVFPVQRATLPEMLRGFIQSMPIDPNCYYFAVSTYSLFGSNEFWDIDEILSSKGAALNYAAGVQMIGNVGVKQPSDVAIEKRLAYMARQVDDIATAVAYHQESFFPRANKLLGWAVRSYTDMRRRNIVFHIDKRCKKCGICAQVCPAQNIQLPNNGSGVSAPIRSDKCEACLACVHWCPAAAVSTSKRMQLRYHNPTVLPAELNSNMPDEEVNKTTGDAFVIPMQGHETSFDAELAAALRDDLLTPADIENWLERTKNPQTPTAADQQEKTQSNKEAHMSSEDIAEALSGLET